MSFRLDSYGTDVGETWRIQGKPNAIRYGIEIETGWSSRSGLDDFFRRMESKHLDKYAVAKMDGSITAGRSGGVGAEIVSRPLVFLECKRIAKRVLDCALNGASEDGTDGDLDLRGCGVHIHTTRDAWDRSALIYARCAVGYRPASAFWDALATRSANEYCGRYETATWGATAPFAGARDRNEAWAQWRAYSSHYDAVSWSGHEPTIEFRLFGATRKSRTVASYLDIVDALLRYATAQVGGRTDKPIDWPAFVPSEFAAWVRTQPGYQALKWRLAHSKNVRAALRPARRRSSTPPEPVLYDASNYPHHETTAALELGRTCGVSTRVDDDGYVCTRRENHTGAHVATWGNDDRDSDFICSWNTTPGQ